MSQLSTLARPYAAAAFKTATAGKSASAWSDMLKFLAVVVQDRNLLAIIANPKTSRQQLTDLLLAIGESQLNREGGNLVKTLIENNRLLLAPQISALYESFKAAHEGYLDVEVVSAYALSKEEQKKITAVLTKQLNKKIHLTTAIDNSLIGGFLARAGDTVIDGSTRGQLQQLAKKL